MCMANLIFRCYICNIFAIYFGIFVLGFLSQPQNQTTYGQTCWAWVSPPNRGKRKITTWLKPIVFFFKPVCYVLCGVLLYRSPMGDLGHLAVSWGTKQTFPHYTPCFLGKHRGKTPPLHTLKSGTGFPSMTQPLSWKPIWPPTVLGWEVMQLQTNHMIRSWVKTGAWTLYNL